jgi:hypothetical protein
MDPLLPCGGIDDRSYVHDVDCAYSNGGQVENK